ncbi:MAG: transcriptional regulator, partial [Erysipelotrichaceae bacterium]|nr:transcriptional regulator [Erysipelotrichaceae bacterium]
MNKIEFLERITELEKLIRIEHELHQDQMAAILGISKKTLVESEKGRRLLGWTEAVALVSIFSDSA